MGDLTESGQGLFNDLIHLSFIQILFYSWLIFYYSSLEASWPTPGKLTPYGQPLYVAKVEARLV
ncbi:MAG: hypothetical protein VXW29_16320 [SAR324 cluster bacterium]|nr:hypothetical protein [SAR324 cluster bacterium]